MICRLTMFLILIAVGAPPTMAQWAVISPGGENNNGQSEGVPSPVMDALGDAVDAFGDGPPLLDIDTLDIRFTTDTLDFSLSFFNEIAPPSLGAINSLVGVIDLDVDQNVTTGFAPLQNSFSPPFVSLGAGIEYRIDLASDDAHPGMLDVVEAEFGTIVGTFPVTYTPTSLSGSMPLSVLADDDGVVNFTAIIGTFPQPTDAMDVLGFSVPVPEPSSLALCTVLVALLLCRFNRQKYCRPLPRS